MKTWIKEFIVVGSLLLIVNLLFKQFSPVELIGSLAVLATFGHAQISNRLLEKESAKLAPDISCYRWAIFYFTAKEVLWLTYFLIHQTYSALAGVIIFLLYPLWRRLYRKYYR